jgi:hypothetical protein
MRVWWCCLLLMGCVAEAPGDPVPPSCETARGPIRVRTTGNYYAPDRVVFHDASGNLIDAVQPRDGIAQLDAPPSCNVDVTLMTAAYGATTAFTVPDVHPGETIEFGGLSSFSDPRPFSITFPELANAYYQFRGPYCTAERTAGGLALGLCYSSGPFTLLALTNLLGSPTPLGYAAVDLTQDATGSYSGAITAWRTDYASTHVTYVNAPAMTSIDASVGQYMAGHLYAYTSSALPGTIADMPRFGDQIVDTTASNDERLDEVLDMLPALPADYTVDLTAELPLRITAHDADGATTPTITWSGDTSRADAIYACGEWSGETFQAWCVLGDPAAGNTIAFPALPPELAPLAPPLHTSVTAVDTSIATSFADVRARPFSASYLPGQDVPPSFRYRASRVGPRSPFMLLR